MGFLSNLINKEVSKQLNKLTNKAGEAISSSIKTGVNESIEAAREAVGAYRPNSVPQLVKQHKEPFSKAVGAVGSDIYDTGSAEYFADVITKNIPGAGVELYVPLSALTSKLPYTSVNIDVLVTLGDKKLAILLPSKNQYRNACYVFTMNACEFAGVPAIRFMKEFDNEAPYVVGRVKSLL